MTLGALIIVDFPPPILPRLQELELTLITTIGASDTIHNYHASTSILFLSSSSLSNLLESRMNTLSFLICSTIIKASSLETPKAPFRTPITQLISEALLLIPLTYSSITPLALLSLHSWKI